MSFQNHPPNGAKPSSRFSTFKVFKLRSGSGSSSLDTAPPPPPKDSIYCSGPNPALNPPPSAFYNRSIFNRSATSLSPSLSPDSGSGPATPLTAYSLPEFAKGHAGIGNVNGRGITASPVLSASGGSLRSVGGGGGDHMPSPSMDGSTDSSGSNPTNVNSNPNANLGMYFLNGANSSSYTMGQASTIGNGGSKRRNIFKLASLARKNKSVKDLSDGASVSASISRSASISDHGEVPPNQEGDEGISMPWNFQHHIHVDEGYIGLPPSWSATLAQAGFDEHEIAAIHARRRAAAGPMSANPYTTYSTERPASPLMPATAPPTSTTTLLPPIPRLTSPDGQNLRLHTPSMYSLASSNGGGQSTIGAPSPAPSPRAPSFSMKSLMNGIKTSLTSDSSSLRDGATDSREEGSRAASEETNQYVFVDGDTPADENTDQGMADETLIDHPYPFDTASISSHQTHTSGHTPSQTPRTPTFPQIQVRHANSDSGHIPFPSNAARAPSPLAHSTSLPIPTPPRGYTYSNHSASPSHSHSVIGSNAGVRLGLAMGTPRTPPKRIYHVSNASPDSGEEQDFAEPPPAYVSPRKGEWSGIREKDPSRPGGSHPPPRRRIPPPPEEEPQGESSRAIHDREDEGGSALNDNEDDIPDPSLDVNLRSIPETADGVLDISSASSSLYIDTPNHGNHAEMDLDGRDQLLSPTPPLVIDNRLTKLATLPPRISFHQEGSLEDWTESLFSAIGKRSSVRLEKRATLRPLSPLAMANTLAIASSSSSAVTTAPALLDMSFGANLTLGLRASAAEVAIAEGDEQEASLAEEAAEDDLVEEEEELDETQTSKEPAVSPMPPSPPHFPDVSLGPNVSSLGKDLGDSVSSRESTSSPELELELEPEAEPSPRASVDSLPPSPPPKPKPTAAPITPPVASTLAPPRINTISNLSGKSPMAALFGAHPLPLPVPIPFSQIRAQLRPAPPKPPYPPPTIPLPPLKRLPPQPSSNLATPPRPQPRPPLPPIPQDDLKPDSSTTPAPPDSRPSSSQTLLPVRSIPGDRDSSLSTITVTAATIATAKTEVVRTAVANIVDSDTVSLVSRRDSVASDNSDAEAQYLEYYERNVQDESPEAPKREEVPDNSLISETSSVSLLRDRSQSTWPAPPPPPPVEETEPNPRPLSRFRSTSLGRLSKAQSMASHLSHRSSDTMSSSASESRPRTMSRPSTASKTKLGIAAEARMLCSMTDTFGGVDVESENGGEASEVHSLPEVTNKALSESPTPLSPSLHPLLMDLQPYLTLCNPTSRFTDLVEIAEGESGSVFAARVLPPTESQPQNEQQDSLERPIPAETSRVAIKRIPLPPPSSTLTLPDDSPLPNKLVSLAHELTLLRDLDFEHLLLLDAVYVSSGSDEQEGADSASAVDTSLWIQMELMERSLADVIGLVTEGLALQERMVGRFASDILSALEYLQNQHIAHRDVRSDNLLLNGSGVVKLADFSSAIRVDRNAPTVNGEAGVIYWQAPEMRAGPYNALKVDIWSLGATVWELAETVPPFSMPASPSTQVTFAVQPARHIGSQWPPLTHPEHYSRAFHEFLRLCGRESAARPGPSELLNTPFIRNACGRAVILQLLSQCRSLEEVVVAREAASE